MKKKPLLNAIIVICLLLSITLLFLFFISPKSTLTIQKPEKYNSLDDFSKIKMQEALKDVINSKKMNFTLTFSEEELNDLLRLVYYTNINNISSLEKIKGMKCVITDKKIEMLANIKNVGPFLAGCKVEFTPTIENNKIALKLEKFFVGAIQVPKSLPLNLLKSKDNSYFSTSVDNSTIIFMNPLPKQFELNKIYIKDHKVNLDVNVSIKSVQDTLDILEVFSK